MTSIWGMRLRWARKADENAGGLVKWEMKCDDEDVRYWWGMISGGYLGWEQMMQIPADLGRHLSKPLKSTVLKAADRSETISICAWSLTARSACGDGDGKLSLASLPSPSPPSPCPFHQCRLERRATPSCGMGDAQSCDVGDHLSPWDSGAIDTSVLQFIQEERETCPG